jgi:FtsP/CotA-like multicopper oxidase with cupredoxin domain
LKPLQRIVTKFTEVRIKLFFPESLAGDIPFHCHLVDHEDNGMMGVLRVTPHSALVR